MPRQRLRFRLNYAVIAVALAVTVVDAATKFWARHALSRHPDHVVGFVWLRLQYNSGISFSINNSGPLVTTIVTVIVAVVVVLVGVQRERRRADDRLWTVAGWGSRQRHRSLGRHAAPGHRLHRRLDVSRL